MKWLGVALLALGVLPDALVAQSDPFAPARLDWTQINVAVVPDSVGGVSVWFLSSRAHYLGDQFQFGVWFDPNTVPAWASRADSLLGDTLLASDTLRWTSSPTLTSIDGALLGWRRAHAHGKWASRVFLELNARPDTSVRNPREPIDIELALADAREFLTTLLEKASISRYVSDTTHRTVFGADQVQQKPEVLSAPLATYPETLRQRYVEGEVWVEVIIDTSGHPDPRTLKILMADDSLFEVVATRQILGTRFRPARVNGKPVRVLVMLPVRFTLRRH